jgi:hypothetical protein
MITIDEIVKRDLIQEIRTFTESDNDDWYPDTPFLGVIPVSKCNRESMFKYLNKVNNCKSILEIGVNDYSGCLSRTLIENKKVETKYLGVDLDPIPFLDESKNLYGIQTDSSNIEEIMSYANSKGIFFFDLILIDGWHSINQVLRDWRFVEYLNDGGIVAMHDTNLHPGPKLFTQNLNTEKYTIDKCCTESNDYGIAFIKVK